MSGYGYSGGYSRALPSTPQVGIGSPPAWHTAEPVLETALPALGEEPRELLPGDVRYVYWRTTAGVRGGPTETFCVRLLVHNAAVSPPAGAVLLLPGEHKTYVRLLDTPEVDTVETDRLLVL